MRRKAEAIGAQSAEYLGADAEAHVALGVATEFDVADLAAGNQGGVALIVHDFQDRAVLDGLGDLLGENFLSLAGLNNDFAGDVANANLDFHESPRRIVRCNQTCAGYGNCLI
ncbi:formamidopyrimidine-DNA glycosylase [Rothia mucilaginosa DY-18]|uniref:Formamidopyrimidine-DNA glycosylase n=1 Tax=Rothia mucilaginosa (strain DY-18) TaxID=680646 RepID=D2NS28_ROTMD|nr:formamidopyrimidine-DNA glycosylase [Rothia mucilaginosa DY-18]